MHLQAGTHDQIACQTPSCPLPHAQRQRSRSTCSALLWAAFLLTLPGQQCLSKQADQEGINREVGREMTSGGRHQVAIGEATLSSQVRSQRKEMGEQRCLHVPNVLRSRLNGQGSKPALSRTCCEAWGESLSFSMLLYPILTF